MGNLDIYNASRAVPKEAQKPITAGRIKGFTDINPMWRIKQLTELFGPCGIGWYYEVTKQWIETAGDEMAAFANISLYIKHEGEWSKPIFGTGGSVFYVSERSGMRMSDEAYKMAATDALSVACKALGIGADVYWDRDVTKYSSGTEGNGRAETTAPKRNDQAVKGTGGRRAENPGASGMKTAGEKPELVTQAMIGSLYGQLKRTGVGLKSLLSCYKVNRVEDLTVPDCKDAMDKLAKRPDKVLPPPAPEDEFMSVPEGQESLPWV